MYLYNYRTIILNKREYRFAGISMSENNSKNKRVKIKANPLIGPLQVLTAILAFFALALAIIIAGGYLTRVVNGTTKQMTLEITEPTIFTTTTVITPKPTPTPTPFVINEILSFGRDRNAIVEDYFGPLPEVETCVPVNHKEVKGIYVGSAYDLEEKLEPFIELAKNSEINTFVIDLKEAYGVIFNSQNELANEIGYVVGAYDLEKVVQVCHENDIYVIGRIVTFKDATLAAKFPDRAICDANGTPLKFSSEGGNLFASPYDTRNWDYIIDLALEAIDMGVDEIQFDYVRFPTGSSTTGNEPYYGADEDLVPQRFEVIDRFLQTARRRIQDPTGIPISADIFGISVSSKLDGYIMGQDWGTVGLTQVDTVCPMLYPSHYALGTILNGHEMEFPDKEPYNVVYNALLVGSQYHNLDGYSIVRPYVQAFTAYYIGEGKYAIYDYETINEQIKGLQDAGLSEFILWNAAGEYPEGNYGGNRG